MFKAGNQNTNFYICLPRVPDWNCQKSRSVQHDDEVSHLAQDKGIMLSPGIRGDSVFDTMLASGTTLRFSQCAMKF